MAPPPQRNGASKAASIAEELETGKERLATERLTEITADLEEELEEVKVKYEMYFLGAERAEPARRRDDLKRNIARLKNAFTRNAGLRFRIQALHARFLSYERLWTRTLREKEAGTYRRDIFRTRLREERRQREAERAVASAAPRAEATAAPPESSTAATSPPSGRRPPPLPPPLPAAKPVPFAIPAHEARAVYDAYVEARRRCNEDVSSLTPEGLARTLSRQVPGILEKFKARRVEFKVEVKNGKAVLKAVPRS